MSKKTPHEVRFYHKFSGRILAVLKTDTDPVFSQVYETVRRIGENEPAVKFADMRIVIKPLE